MTEWILSSNPKRFRVDDAFHDLLCLEWYQNKSIRNIQQGDICYIYLSSPVQEIHWKCVVTDVMRLIPKIDDLAYDIPPSPPGSAAGPVIELKVLYEYETPELLSYENLKQHGLKTKMMGPSRVSSELSKYLSEIEKIQTDPDSKANYFNSLTADELKKLALKHSGKAKPKKVAASVSYVRDIHIAEYAKIRANGLCQLCGKSAPFKDKNGRAYLESHHVIWLSRGGDDSISNTVALCPNCHKRMHVVDDPLDIKLLLKKAYETS